CSRDLLEYFYAMDYW
nr:immunoglobulin heavy chain junction region [Mus musculus]